MSEESKTTQRRVVFLALAAIVCVAQAPSRQWFTEPNIDQTSSNRTIPKTLASRIPPVLNIKDFGAIGDGVTDDTAAYENCRIIAKREGRPVAVDDGTYLILGKVMTAEEIVHMAMKGLGHD